MSAESIIKIGEFFSKERYPSGSKLNSTNRDTFYLLSKGFVKVALNRPSSTRYIAISGPKELVDYDCHENNYIITCISEIEVFRIERKRFEELKEKSPELYWEIMLAGKRTICHRDRQLFVLGKRSVRERVSGTLLGLYEAFECDESSVDNCVLKVDKTAIADLSNVTLESLSRTLTEFENDNIVKRVGFFVAVTNKLKLQQYFES